MTNDPRAKRWRRLVEANTPVHLQSLSVIESDAFEIQTVDFQRVTALTGSHGTGKSLLLRTVEALFGYATPTMVPPFIRIGDSTYERDRLGGVFEVTVMTPEGCLTRRVNVGDTAERRLETWRDAEVDDAPLTANWWPSYCGPIYAFAELNNLEDYIRTEDRLSDCKHSNLSPEDLRGLKNILGRSYDRVTVYTFPTESADDLGHDYPIPLVFAEHGGKVIDSSKMSTGELWVHYLLWFLREAEEGTFVLIDEPEAFIASRGHRALADEIARYCLRKDLQLLVATHSPDILSRFPLSHVRMCIRSSEKIEIVRPTSLVQLRDAVGVESAVRGLVLVEDDMAVHVLRSVLGDFDVSLTRELEIVPAFGEANVIAGLRSFESSSRIAVVAVLDGDQRNSIKDSPRLFFLPGKRSPEDELLDLTKNGLERLAGIIGRPVTDISATLSNLAGLDHQYQLRKLAEELGVPESFIRHALVKTWLNRPEIRNAASNLVDALRSAVNRQY
nr:hypothetical protein GCM10020063_095150 [Dactylosporangium thailandense]